MEIYTVVLRKKASVNLKNIPKHIIAKLTAWIEAVGYDGLSEVKKYLDIMMSLYVELEMVSAQ